MHENRTTDGQGINMAVAACLISRARWIYAEQITTAQTNLAVTSWIVQTHVQRSRCMRAVWQRDNNVNLYAGLMMAGN